MNKTLRTSSILCVAFVLISQLILAQEKRASPPATAKGKVSGKEITINYSSPSVKGRVIWGDLVPYDKIWRTGANEATTIAFSDDVKIDGKEIKAGKYALFTVPGKDKWQVILNSVPDQWGAYNYDKSKDVHAFTVTPKKAPMTESLTFEVNDKGVVSMKWEKLKIEFAVK